MKGRRQIVAVAVLVVGAGGAAAQAVGHDPQVQAIMATAVNPAALAFWAGGNDPPENETPEAAALRWEAAAKGARTLRTAAAELQAHSRPGRWDAFAGMMADAAGEGEGAAKARDAEKAFEIGGRLYEACDGCHKTYIPTPRPPA